MIDHKIIAFLQGIVCSDIQVMEIDFWVQMSRVNDK